MKLRPAQEHHGPGVFHYYCPGCKCEHSVFTQNPNSLGAKWSWNGDMEKPTFTPSLLMRWTSGDPPVTSENYDQWKANPWPQTDKNNVCHVFITNGMIQFLGDCTHELAGQTVELPNIEP